MGSKESNPRERVAESLRCRGVTKTSELLGLSAEATLRYAGGFGSQVGTEAQVLSRLDRLDGPTEAP